MITVKDKNFKILISSSTVQQRVAALGKQIFKDYQDKTPIFIGMLNGGFAFMGDLVKHFAADCAIEFVKYSSYQGLTSTGKIKAVLDLQSSIKDRHVIVVEDIVDTGRTMNAYFKELATQQPASVALASLLLKPDAVQVPVKIDYLGFEIEDKFVIGYGLDYDGYGRNYPAIYQLAE